MDKLINHGVPYSLIEEYIGIYQMHSLMPDKLIFRDIHGTPQHNKIPLVLKEVELSHLKHLVREVTLSNICNKIWIALMGHQDCGELTLWNYPWIREIIPQNPNGEDRDNIDLPALEIYHDRDKSISRYNQFQKNLLMIPITKWEDLTNDVESIKIL
eukprot:Gb_32762 [translate_table: standard]